MIAEYEAESGFFMIKTRAGAIIYIGPKEMKELIETAQIAVSDRFQQTGRMTV